MTDQESLGAAMAMSERYQATHDPHTGLPNMDLLLREIDKSQRMGKACALIFLMVNGINEVGEHHGIAASFHALGIVSKRMRETIKDGGFAAHIQGELFAVITHGADPGTVAERLMSELTRSIPWQMAELHLVVAAGVVSNADAPEKAEALVRAGYSAARHGLARNTGGSVHMYSAELGRQLERQYQVMARLRPALANGGLSFTLQAEVGAVDGRLLGAEALITWNDDQLGAVPPSEFIPLAERNGTITEITAWVLRKALAIANEWQRIGLDLSVAVNLSARNLHAWVST